MASSNKPIVLHDMIEKKYTIRPGKFGDLLAEVKVTGGRDEE